MNIYNLSFPSGRSVERCKQDAKALVKSTKNSSSPIPLNAALDKIAHDNGINLSWAAAIKQLKIGKRKEPKVALVHLLGHALNTLIKKKLIYLDRTEGSDRGFLECELVGKPAVINWEYIGYGEIRLSVWWNFDKTKHPQHLEGGYKNKVILDDLAEEEQKKYWGTNKGIFSTSNTVEKYQTDEPLAKRGKFKDFVGVVCSTWVERKKGKYLQTEGGRRITGSYIRTTDKQALCTIPECNPLGFRLNGKFHM